MSSSHPDTPPSVFQPLTAEDPDQVGGYQLCARLGAGGMGRVYLAYTPGGRPVALKVVRPELAEDQEFRERFALEVSSARRVRGLFTAELVDAGVDDALPWLATAYVPGPSLHEVLRRHGPLGEGTVLMLVAGIAEALQEIHAGGVVHRDLKPANVLLAPDGPRVIDFGIARAADAGALTATGLRIGSPGYMAPEQALGLPATPATDVFALGALATAIAGGNPPFGNGPASTALYRVVHEEPDLTGVPAGLHELLLHCLAKTPEHRPSTAEVIDRVRRHPAIGGQLRFSDNWLPQQIAAELTRRAELPPTPTVLDRPPALLGDHRPPAPPAAHRPPTPFAEHRALAHPADQRPPVVLAGHPSAAADPDRRPRRRAARRTALIAAAALLLGIGGTFYLLDPGAADDAQAVDPPAPAAAPPTTAPASPAPSPSGTAPAGSANPGATPPPYTAVYRGVDLSSSDHTYEFDLRAGKVSPQETATWYLARTATEFTLPDDTTAYLGFGDQLSPADCLKGLATRPTTGLSFDILTNGQYFCLQSATTRDLAVVRVLSVTPDDGPVHVSIDYYRPTG